MRGKNLVILIGNLGADPETRYSTSGSAITNIRIATSESWKDKESGEQQERTEWHRVTFFGRLAEIAGEYLKKGSQVYIEGKLRTSEYEKDGVKRYSTDIVADEMQMLGTRQGDTGGESQAPRSQGAPAPNHRASAPSNRAPQGSQQHAPQRAPQRAPAAPVPAGDSFDDGFDNDVPF